MDSGAARGGEIRSHDARATAGSLHALQLRLDRQEACDQAAADGTNAPRLPGSRRDRGRGRDPAPRRWARDGRRGRRALRGGARRVSQPLARRPGAARALPRRRRRSPQPDQCLDRRLFRRVHRLSHGRLLRLRPRGRRCHRGAPAGADPLSRRRYDSRGDRACLPAPGADPVRLLWPYRNHDQSGDRLFHSA